MYNPDMAEAAALLFGLAAGFPPAYTFLTGLRDTKGGSPIRAVSSFGATAGLLGGEGWGGYQVVELLTREEQGLLVIVGLSVVFLAHAAIGSVAYAFQSSR